MNTSLWLWRSCECLQEAQPQVECSRRHSPRPCGSQRGPPHGPAQGLQCLSSLRVCVFSIKEIWEAACRAVLWEPGHRGCVSVILAGPAGPGSGARAGHTRKALALVCFQNLDVPVMGDNTLFLFQIQRNYTIISSPVIYLAMMGIHEVIVYAS